MQTFKTDGAQGELSLRKISKIPKDAKPVTPVNGQLIVGHSETGHHHVLTAEHAKVFESTTAPAGMRVLYAIVTEPTTLDHLRPFDTHESLGVQPGMYEIRVGREYDPYEELARLQAD